jgi:hypothetical protein
VAGDTIRVAAGTYANLAATDQIVLLDTSATLSGGWNATFTGQSGVSVIDAKVQPGLPYHRGITVNEGVTSNVESFVVENGEAPSFPGGGGILNKGQLTLRDSVVTTSSSAVGISGGGIYNSGTLTLEDSSVIDNFGVEGAGIGNAGTLTLERSTVASNDGRDGGGIHNYFYGVLRVANSAIFNNTTFVNGAGIFSEGAVTLTNSTVSGNQAAPPWAGGGIYIIGNGTLIANSSTITNNSAGEGGGIYLGGGYPSTFVTLRNSLVAGNIAPYSPDCRYVIQSAGYNLIGNTLGCAFVSSTGDQLNVAPQLGPLADNGGPTLTHALQPGSPAIDAGNPAGCKDENDTLITKDQRGAPRPFGTSCDIGAYEFGASVDTTPPEITVPADITVNATSPAGADVTYTVTASDEDPENPTVTCTPPSGSVFPIGGTTVNCEATDAAENTGTANFTITVKGAAAQLADLAINVEGVGPGTSLADKVKAAQAALAKTELPETCSILMAFINQVKAQSGKVIVPSTATSLIANATRIRAVLGC